MNDPKIRPALTRDCDVQLQPALEAFLAKHGFVNVREEYPVHGDVLYIHERYIAQASSSSINVNVGAGNDMKEEDASCHH